MFNKQILLALAAVACMASATSAFAAEHGGLYRDINGDLHYEMCAEGRSLMQAEDMTSNGYWVVPKKVLAMAPDVIPVHEVLGVSEEEFEQFNKGQGGNLPWKRFDGVVVPVNEVLDMNEDEFEQFNKGQGGKKPDRFVKPGSAYNPATWGYTPKTLLAERIKR